ncbi:kinase-like domain-containing protein [Parachaetomium inaequale]|uniref:dual-specificity kinase n=1 Tax=Parachaetomium inaequale TaxID=2588326 RepID=A0AAN6PIV0_9PEZI|nr:kinase-like domain-containing protein [Parachaetomium inaequale]
MSTPTTATATLPHYSPHHFRYPHHQHQHQPYPQSNSSSYRPPNPILPPATRLAYPSPGYSSAASHTSANGVAAVPSDHARLAPIDAADGTSRLDHIYPTMPAASQAQPPAEPQPARKKRRSREPDWKTFYKNGLPKEIIVIDDTPEPDRPNAAAAAAQALANGRQHVAANGAASSSAKKRKRDDEPTPYDPVHHSAAVGSHTPSKSTAASDRTNSAIHTTAATSLGSLSSNGHYEYDTQPGQKRKRTTRQQIANEARRREAAIYTDALAHYRPPPYPPKKARDVHIKVVPDPPHSKNIRVDDDDGHYIVVPDNDLTERYQMVKLLGQGTFGKVVQARDKVSEKLVAIKIIRSVQKYREASKIELRVLETLRANDEENRNRCIHFRDCFDYRGHICIVMDLLGQSVFDFLKSNSFVPFPNSQIQNFARQLLTSVAFLHDLNLIHTDLKPENILLCHNEYQTFTYNRKIPSASTNNSNRQASQRKVLLDTEIRLIDFGSATFQDEYHSSVVSTRHYRAPEIILGLGWSYPCDIWSIGCILVEFFTGDALFQTHDNLEHLAMMESVVDARIDPSLVQQVNKMTRNGGNPASKYFKRLKLDYPMPDTTRASRRFVKAMKRLPDIIPPSTKFLQQFLDLLQKIFVYDPAHRITAKQALQHPWFREVAHPDDGTEAARIRADKQRMREREPSRASHGPVVEERAVRR